MAKDGSPSANLVFAKIGMMLWKLLTKLLPSRVAYAHCDVPCGIYDPKPSQLAAQTMLKMTQFILDPASDEHKKVRAIMTKEEHGRILKHELSILWSDYFKPEHLEKYPDLHTKFWMAAKLASKVKQTVDEAAAKDLVKAVDEIADIFAETKKPA